MHVPDGLRGSQIYLKPWRAADNLVRMASAIAVWMPRADPLVPINARGRHTRNGVYVAVFVAVLMTMLMTHRWSREVCGAQACGDWMHLNELSGGRRGRR